MREIKFRAWDKITESFDVEDMTIVDFMTVKHPKYAKELVWQQYTGLKDKNGKEIYEGDIVKDENGEKTEVKWDNHNSRFDFAKGFPVDTLEVIGNVYQNKDLLKKTYEQ